MSGKFELSALGNLVVVLSLFVLVAAGLPGLDFFGKTAAYLTVHGMLEAASVLAIWAAAALCFTCRNSPDSSRMMMLSAGFVAVGAIDVLHTLSYEDMPIMFTPSNPEKAINFWLAARLWAALILLTFTLLAPGRTASAGKTMALFAGNIALVAVVFYVGIFFEDALPATFIANQGLTHFKVGAEIVIASIFAAASWRLFRAPEGFSPVGVSYPLLAAAAWIFALAEVFLCFYSDVSDIFNLSGHIYKLIASVMVLLAVRGCRVFGPTQRTA